MVSRSAAVAAHTHRVRQAGGKRTSVDLTAAALVDLETLRSTGNSLSVTICRALAIAANLQRAASTMRNLTTLDQP
jgi:hypothetical protein